MDSPSRIAPAGPSIENEAAARSSRGRSPFVPLLLLACAFAVWTIFQTVQLSRERDALNTTRTGQDATIEQAQKMRAQLDSIARGTAQLAQQGNPNASLIIEELRKRGITVNLNAPTGK